MARFRTTWARIRRVLWLVLINVAVFLGLVVMTNIASAFLLALSRSPTARGTVHDVLGIGGTPVTRAAKLPPYAGHEERAKEIWEELERSRRVEYVPFIEWRRRSFNGKWITVSESGDRIYRSPVKPPAGAPVIRFFGGSSMWGTGVEDSETIPANFTRLHPRYRVYNHGEASYTSRQNLERLINLMTRAQRTDVAVFYEGFNDVLTLCQKDVDLNGHGEQVSVRRRLSREQSIGDLFYGQTLRLLRKILGSHRRSFLCARNPDRARQVAETVLNVWRLARTLQEANCGRLVVVLQPVAAIGRARVDYIGLDKQATNSLESGKELRAVYPYWQAAAKRPENRWLHDFTGAYDGSRPIYVDFIHVAEAGNQIMARRIEPLLERALADVHSDSACRGRS